jgi:hypothetical protein
MARPRALRRKRGRKGVDVGGWTESDLFSPARPPPFSLTTLPISLLSLLSVDSRALFSLQRCGTCQHSLLVASILPTIACLTGHASPPPHPAAARGRDARAQLLDSPRPVGFGTEPRRRLCPGQDQGERPRCLEPSAFSVRGRRLGKPAGQRRGRSPGALCPIQRSSARARAVLIALALQ